MNGISELGLILISSALWAVSIAMLSISVPPHLDSFWERFFLKDLRGQIHILQWDEQTTREQLRWWALSIVVTFMVLGIGFSMLPVAIGLCVLMFMAPSIYIEQAVVRRKRELKDELAVGAIMLSNSCRARLSLVQSFGEIGKELHGPFAAEIRRISNVWHRGRPLTDAIKDAQERLNIDDFSLFASAVMVSLKQCGNVADTLDAIAKSLREGQRLERKLEADTASGRKVILVLAAFPAVFLAGFMFLEPKGTSLLFTTIAGQLLLVLIGVLVYVSVRWGNKILAVEV